MLVPYGFFKGFDDEILNQITVQTKYEGYISKEQKQIEQAKKQEDIKLPKDFDYSVIKGLRTEAMEKLNIVKPLTLAQAGRISGVNPPDISVLTIWLKSQGMC